MGREAAATIIDPISDPRWTSLMDAPDACIFHHPAWLRNLRDSYRYGLWAACVLDDASLPVAGLPVATVCSRLTGNRLVSVPFSDVCRPITGGDDDLLEPLAGVLEGERERIGLPLEVHGELEAGGPSGRGDAFLHHTLDLAPGWEALWGSMRPVKRAQVRKAKRMGVSLHRSIDARELDAFYVLHIRTRRRLGAPTQPKRFIRGLAPMFAQGLGFVLLALHEGRPIAATVLLTFNGVMTVKFNASDERKQHLAPNQLMYAEAIRLACESGYSTFDFGRTELDNDGLRKWKEALGASGRPLSYTLVPPRSGKNSVRAVSDFQRSMIRRGPALLGRVVGAVAYRHFG